MPAFPHGDVMTHTRCPALTSSYAQFHPIPASEPRDGSQLYADRRIFILRYVETSLVHADLQTISLADKSAIFTANRS